MKLSSLNKFIGLLILLISSQSLHSEEEIDIWNKDVKKKSTIIKTETTSNHQKDISKKKYHNDLPGTSILTHKKLLA